MKNPKADIIEKKAIARIGAEVVALYLRVSVIQTILESQKVVPPGAVDELVMALRAEYVVVASGLQLDAQRQDVERLRARVLDLLAKHEGPVQ